MSNIDREELLATLKLKKVNYEDDQMTAPTRDHLEAGPSGQGKANNEGGNNWALSYQQFKGTELQEKRDLNHVLIRNTRHFLEFSVQSESAADLAQLYYETHSECNAAGKRPANLPGGATWSKNVPAKLEWGKSSQRHQSLDKFRQNSNDISENKEFNRSGGNVHVTNNKRNSHIKAIRAMQQAMEPADDELQGLSRKPRQFCDKFKQNNNNIRAKGKINRPGDEAPKKERTNKKQKNEAMPVKQKWVPIGSGNTMVLSGFYNMIDFKGSYTQATRILLMAVFSREVLATHSLTGKPSPAFLDKPAKMCLDRNKISDIIMEVVKNSKVRANRVRQTITIKCADECKMMRARCKKGASTE